MSDINFIMGGIDIKRKLSFRRRVSFFLRKVGIFNTIRFNFINFPFRKAIKLPVLVGSHVQFIGLRRGCIRFNPDVKIRYGIVELGITRYPIISTKCLYTLIRIHSDSHIEVGENVKIFNGCSLIASLGGVIHIGNDFIMNQKARIYACNKVSFGNHCRFGWESQMMDSDFHYVYNENSRTIKPENATIVIGNNCWLANRVTVMKGTVLPDYSILSGGSLLNKNFSSITTSGNFFAGTPALLKCTGVFRIFSENTEKKLRCFFKSQGTNAFVTVPVNYPIYDILDD